MTESVFCRFSSQYCCVVDTTSLAPVPGSHKSCSDHKREIVRVCPANSYKNKTKHYLSYNYLRITTTTKKQILRKSICWFTFDSDSNMCKWNGIISHTDIRTSVTMWSNQWRNFIVFRSRRLSKMLCCQVNELFVVYSTSTSKYEPTKNSIQFHTSLFNKFFKSIFLSQCKPWWSIISFHIVKQIILSYRFDIFSGSKDGSTQGSSLIGRRVKMIENHFLQVRLNLLHLP